MGLLFEALQKGMTSLVVLFLMMGDMVVDTSHQPHPTKGASLLHVELWEDGILPIQFESYLSQEKRQMFMEACKAWGLNANVRCVEGSYKNRVISVTTALPGCWAPWGMGTYYGGLNRQINLADNCWNTSILIHEIGHALGLIHEHQRADRDDYIEIKTENIKYDFLGLAQKINYDKQDMELSTPYDFYSIMHYRAYQDLDADNPVITVKPPNEFYEFIIGYAYTPSFEDHQIMVNLYGKRSEGKTFGSSATRVCDSSTLKPSCGSQVFK